jgi:CDP-glucose 4,6-dehydratase
MESLGVKKLFANIYENRKVLVTGHTGFKGSWLVLWLSQIGAKVIGYALEAPTSPNHIELLDLDFLSITSDIRDGEKLRAIIAQELPEIVFHLAAQSLVRRGYHEPVETFSTNVMGTINLLEACRDSESVRAVIVVTSDKCYENLEQEHGYHENDSLGGYGPYSASKACAEIVTSSYRRSYFPIEEYGKKHKVLVATARAGNVIGGGDWSEDRLIPDIVKAASNDETVVIRNPDSTRPWQHVLESLSGYLMLGGRLLEGKNEFAEPWNFGPYQEEDVSVGNIAKQLQKYWNKIKLDLTDKQSNLYEAKLLRLDCSKAFNKLGWRPAWNTSEAIEMTVNWYRSFYEDKKVISETQLAEYVATAKRKNLEWSKS